MGYDVTGSCMAIRKKALSFLFFFTLLTLSPSVYSQVGTLELNQQLSEIAQSDLIAQNQNIRKKRRKKRRIKRKRKVQKKQLLQKSKSKRKVNKRKTVKRRSSKKFLSKKIQKKRQPTWQSKFSYAGSMLLYEEILPLKTLSANERLLAKHRFLGVGINYLLYKGHWGFGLDLTGFFGQTTLGSTNDSSIDYFQRANLSYGASLAIKTKYFVSSTVSLDIEANGIYRISNWKQPSEVDNITFAGYEIQNESHLLSFLNLGFNWHFDQWIFTQKIGASQEANSALWIFSVSKNI